MDDVLQQLPPLWQLLVAFLFTVSLLVNILVLGRRLLGKSKTERDRERLEVQKLALEVAKMAESQPQMVTPIRRMSDTLLENHDLHTMLLRFVLIYFILLFWGVASGLIQSSLWGAQSGLSLMAFLRPGGLDSDALMNGGMALNFAMSISQLFFEIATLVIVLVFALPLYRDVSRVLGPRQ